MEEIVIPIRTQTIYQTDNGMRIERWNKIGEHRKTKEPEDPTDYNLATDLFVGVVQIMTQVGPREFKFEIEAKDINEAFKKYVPFAKSSIDSYQKQINLQQLNASQGGQVPEQELVIAPAEALDQLDRMRENQQKGGNNIFLP